MYQHQRAKQPEWLCCPGDINAGLSTEQMFSALLRWKGMFTVKITLHMFLISLLQKHLGEIHRADLQVYYLLRRPIGSCAGTKMVVTLCAINSLYTFEFCNGRLSKAHFLHQWGLSHCFSQWPRSLSTGSPLRDWEWGGVMGEKSWSIITAKFLWTQDRTTFAFTICDTLKYALHRHMTSSRQVWQIIFYIHLWAKSVWQYLKKNFFTSLSNHRKITSESCTSAVREKMPCGAWGHRCIPTSN